MCDMKKLTKIFGVLLISLLAVAGLKSETESSNTDHLIPEDTPFSYNVGINYESWTMGRDHRDISADLDAITKHFKLIKTFHAAAVGTKEVIIDPTQQEVITYITTHQDNGIIELAMGTNSSALATGGFGQPWSPGLMTDSSYTDKWVQMIISAFGGTSAVKQHLKVILLGNEIDANGPPKDNSNFHDYYSNWIPSAFNNLKASLKKAGLGSIPVSTIIANYPEGDPNSNIVASSVTNYIKTHWSMSVSAKKKTKMQYSAVWNKGKPFVMFNQYTPNGGKSTDFSSVINYFNTVDTILGGNPYVFVGETGFSAEFGLTNEANVIGQVFTWLDGQHKRNGMTIPLFIFQAFDRSAKPAGQKEMGIFSQDSSNRPTGLKSGITIPDWVSKPR